jgi:hypothetical protein
MTRIGDNVAASRLFSELEGLFKSDEAFFSIHQHLSFVCGASGDTHADGTPTLRGQFLHFLTANPPKHKILPIVAEEAIEEFLAEETATFLDLGRFEELIAGIVDSVLIFPESPGSFAELGFFAATNSLASKTLVINRQAYQGQSFINLGPIPLYNRLSVYQPMPLVLGDDLTKGFHQAVAKLQFQTDKRKYRKRFAFGPFPELGAKEQLVVLYEIIRVFGYIEEQNLRACVARLFGRYDVDRVRRLLAILVAMNYVGRSEHGDYKIQHAAPALLEYQRNRFESAKAQVIRFYQKHDAVAAAALNIS